MTSKGLLHNKTIIVTGGAGTGIGQGLSTVIAREGAKLVIFEKDVATMNRLLRRLRRKHPSVLGWECDVANAVQVEIAVTQVLKKFGRIDGLVNSAGEGLIGPVHEVTETEYQRLMGINFYGVFACCRSVLPAMVKQQGGSIVNISSVHAERTMENYGLYAAAKAGVQGLTRGLAVQYGPQGIRVNAVLPGLVDGKQTRQTILKLTQNVEAWMEGFAKRRQCLNRAILPTDVGELVAFLLSDRAACITGAALPIDAGALALLSAKD